MGLWRPALPVHAPTLSRRGEPARAARRSAVYGTLAYLAAVAGGAWAITNLEDVPWVTENGWWSLTHLAAPAAALAAVLGASGAAWSGMLTVRDGIAFAVGVAIVTTASVGTWLWIGPTQSLTPLLVGAAALVVMRTALVERTFRTAADPDN